MTRAVWNSLPRFRWFSTAKFAMWLSLVFVFGSAYCRAAAAATSKVAISCDLDCAFALDKFQGQITAGKEATVELASGSYTLEVASSDGADYWKDNITIPDRGTSPYEVRVPLQSERSKRLVKEQELKALQDSADVKRQKLALVKTENAELAKEGPETAAIGKETVRLIEKYSARYESELKAGNARKQATESVKASLPATTTTTYAALAKAAGEAALLKLYSESQRHFLAADAAMYRIKLLTSLLNVLSKGAHSKPARALLRDALTYQVSWDSSSARLWIADSTMDLRRGDAPAEARSNNAADSPQLSFNCAAIRDVHTEGPPVVRTLAEVAGTSAFVVKLTSRSLNLSGMSDNDRKIIMGTFFLACPALTADSPLDPAWLTALQRVQWPASQTSTARRATSPQVSTKQSPPTKTAVAQGATNPPGASPASVTPNSRAQVAGGRPDQIPIRPSTPPVGGIYLDPSKQKQQTTKDLDKKIQQAEQDAEDVPKNP